MKNIIITIIAIVLIAVIVYFFVRNPTPATPPADETPITTPTSTDKTSSTTMMEKTSTVIGTSVEGRDIVAYHVGNGPKEILFVGGVHGGYEWNTALVAYKLLDYFKKNKGEIPSNQTLTIIPVLNPDGLYSVVGTTTGNFSAENITGDSAKVVAGRYNANKVDLNRNFDCDWQKTGTWNTTPVSGGTSAFSEPETKAIKSYIDSRSPKAVVVWYSSAGGVFASNCHGTVSDETNTLTKSFAEASGYPAHQTFDFYATTGDMTNWLAKVGIPAISVLLTNHTDIELNKNLAGAKAVLKYYAE